MIRLSSVAGRFEVLHPLRMFVVITFWSCFPQWCFDPVTVRTTLLPNSTITAATAPTYRGLIVSVMGSTSATPDTKKAKVAPRVKGPHILVQTLHIYLVLDLGATDPDCQLGAVLLDK
jgi:hypothetical protein